MKHNHNKKDPKDIGREKLHLALENLKLAESEGAQKWAPDTYIWAKHKIYEDKKLILKNPDDEEIIEEASDDASAAAAQLLSMVRKSKSDYCPTPEISEAQAIKNLVNEGGPAI